MSIGLVVGSVTTVTFAAIPPSLLPQTNAQSTNGASRLSLEWVINNVLSNNAALKAVRANREATEARIAQARAWDDPKFGADVERSGQTSLAGYSDIELSLAQRLPLSRRNHLMARAASAQADAAHQSVRRRELDLTSQCRIAYFRFANLHAQLELNSRTEQLLQQLVSSSRSRYETGEGTLAEVLEAETERARISETRVDLDRQLATEETRLNVLMNRPPREFLAAPDALAFRPMVLSRYRPPPSAHTTDDDRSAIDWSLFELHLQATASAHRPELAAAKQILEATQALERAARRQRVPDPELRVEMRLGQDPGGLREYDTGLSFPVTPLNWPKYRGIQSEAALRREAAENDTRTEQIVTEQLVYDQLRKAATLQFHYLAFRNRIVPLSHQASQSIQANYLSGKASFFELLTAFRRAQEAESAMQQHLADYLSSIAELEAIAGADPELAPSTSERK